MGTFAIVSDVHLTGRIDDDNIRNKNEAKTEKNELKNYKVTKKKKTTAQPATTNRKNNKCVCVCAGHATIKRGKEICFTICSQFSHMFTITYRFAFVSLSLLKSNLLQGIELRPMHSPFTASIRRARHKKHNANEMRRREAEGRGEEKKNSHTIRHMHSTFDTF